MVRKVNINEVRSFTSRNGGNVGKWLPSIGGDFQNTFTLNGENYDGSSSKGEINSNTVFGKNKDELGKTYDNTKVLEDNLLKFNLILYCFLQDPLKFPNIAGPVLNQIDIKNDRLFNQGLERFFFNFQTGNVTSNISRSLTCDAVRYYRNKNVGNLDPIKEETFTNLIKFAQSNKGYQTNVAGVLGGVTYDSIVKHTLYSLLKTNNKIPDIESTSIPWTQKAQQIEAGKLDIFVDVGGGPYVRAFPVACVIFQDSKGKNINDILEKANNLVGETFKRKLNGENQLVTPINNKEKNFIEIPLRDSTKTNSSVYCIVYDLIKVLVLNPTPTETNFSDLIKIGLSLLSRLGFGQKYKFTKTSLLEEINNVKQYLNNNFSNLNNEYSILFQNKHTLETSYILKDALESLQPKIAQSFSAEIQNLSNSLEQVYQKIVNNIKEESFYLHFDKFYNLLAVTADKKISTTLTNEVSEGPFILEEYASIGIESDLINLFFQNLQTLPTYEQIYTYNPDIAKSQKVLYITNTFITELYEILDSSGEGLVYENDTNSETDGILKISSSVIKLLDLIKQRTNEKYILNKNEYFIKNAQGKIETKNLPSETQILDIDVLPYSFASVGISKIKLQTLSHFLFVTKKENPNDDDFLKIIYYPRLKLSVSPRPRITEEIQKRESNPPNPRQEGRVPELIGKVKDLAKRESENRDFLINNIITSELGCYEDIAQSVDNLVNSDLPSEEKLYQVFQVVYTIGLPFLLATVSQILSSKLNELLKNGDSIDPALLECVNKDINKVKKTIINYVDLLSNLENSDQLIGLFLQEIPEIPQIPQIQYLFTFDAEKELKRKVIEYVINELLKFVSGTLRNVLKNFVDLCNADSYLFTFLQQSFDLGQEQTKKLATPTPSGMPVGNTGPVYIPSSFVNINDLIEKSGVETKDYVYEQFRKTFFVSKEQYTNETISLFFSKLSEVVDAGEMASLLKGTSSIETKNVVLGFIKNYLVTNNIGKFAIIISDQQSVLLLFSLLSQYINYRLCYEELAKSLVNFTPTVCFDPNSKYDENIKYFSDENIQDEISELTKTLDDICSNKLPKAFDLLDNGPSVAAKSLVKNIVNCVQTTINYKPPITTSNISGNTEQIKTPQMIYDSAKLFPETANTLKLISELKNKSKFVLEQSFRIGMSFTDYNFVITFPNGEKPGVTLTDSLTRFFQKISGDSLLQTTKFVNFQNYYGQTEEFVSSFLDQIKWKGEDLNLPFGSTPQATSLYQRKNNDNLFLDEYFSKQNVNISENSAKMWKIITKTPPNQPYNAEFSSLFNGDSLRGYWVYYLYLLCNFHQPFIQEVTKSVNSKEEDDKIAVLFETLKETPSLEQYYIFAYKIYEIAYELEKELYGVDILTEDLAPWLEIDIRNFSLYAVNKGSYTKEINNFINSLGNYAIKTEQMAIDGYLKEYEIFRKTNTKIYNSSPSGQPVINPNLVISFVEKE